MIMQPPAQVNKMMTDARNHWLMSQPTTTTIAIPDGVEVPKDLSTAELISVIREWGGSDKPLKITSTPPGIQDYPIEDNVRRVMLQELVYILDYNGFESELLGDDSLKVSRDRWSMEIENILEQMPFSDWLPYQIESHYKHSLYESQNTDRNQDEYPSRERLESIRRDIVDKMAPNSTLDNEGRDG